MVLREESRASERLLLLLIVILGLILAASDIESEQGIDKEVVEKFLRHDPNGGIKFMFGGKEKKPI